ncbi:MAG TPA: hypothetical protein VFA58_07335, partial [Chthoniobacterales bacterium]|nr:hypothetical protein [Chthoniobacterales bacterium]
MTTRLSHAAFACLLLMGLTALVNAQTAADNPTGVTGVYNGNITTAGSYDPFTGNQMRVVDDLVVQGSVGAYPLKWTRYYNTNVQDGQWTFSYKDYKDDALNFNIFLPDGRHVGQSASDGKGVPDYGVPFPLDGRTYPGIFLSDGGQVLFKGNTARPVGLVDPYGQMTQITYADVGSGNIQMDKVIEPGGRYLQLSWQASPATSGGYVISKVEAFDGQGNSLGWVQYSWSASVEQHGLYARLDQATYADGTSAHYTYGKDTL